MNEEEKKQSELAEVIAMTESEKLKQAQALAAAEAERLQQAKAGEGKSLFANKSEEHTDDWKKILKAYKDEHPDAPERDDGVLEFKSPADAKAFFTAQAESGKSFFASEIDKSGNLTGQHMFSCGTGKLYSGTDSEIQKALQADLQKDPDNKKLAAGLDRINAYMKNDAPEKEGAKKEEPEKEEPKKEGPEKEDKQQFRPAMAPPRDSSSDNNLNEGVKQETGGNRPQ